jgi:hypothetical protein
MTKAFTTDVSLRFANPVLSVMIQLGTTVKVFLFGILNLGHWDLFEPALARLDRFKPPSVAEFR